MNRIGKTAWRLLVSGALLPLVGAGCGASSGAAPAGAAARAALEASLTAWTRGATPAELSKSEPPVLVHDTPWGRGQKLASFEVLREEPSASPERQFIVRLSLTKPDRTEEVKYHVLDTGSLMVFRDEDFLRNINMENGPSLPRPGGPARQPR